MPSPLTFKGFNAHPGYAKGRMVSAIKLASEFVHRLPRHGLSPETTDGYEGYVHPHTLQGGVELATVKLLLRDFTTKGLDDKARMLNELADEVVRPYPAASVEIDRRESYRNMKEVLDRHPEVTEHAKAAMMRAGLTPRLPADSRRAPTARASRSWGSRRRTCSQESTTSIHGLNGRLSRIWTRQ